MLRRGENPADFEQLHQELIEAGEPDDVMQEMSVKTIAEKSWDKEQLRAAWRESQLTALQVGQIQGQRRQLLAPLASRHPGRRGGSPRPLAGQGPTVQMQANV
ncbi:MAG: hypothetical protein ACLQOO_34655 [Terriglobia bacterium]